MFSVKLEVLSQKILCFELYHELRNKRFGPLDKKRALLRVLEIIPWIDDHVFHLQIKRVLVSLFPFQLESDPIVMGSRVYQNCKGLWDI